MVVAERLATYQSKANHDDSNDNHDNDIGSSASLTDRMIIVLAF